MAAAAHDVWRAEHDEIAAAGRLARGFLVDRKFGNADALGAECLSHLWSCIVVREHSYIGRTRDACQPLDGFRDFIALRQDVRYQTIEFFVRDAAALHHLGTLLRPFSIAYDGIHVVIEREQID